NRRCRLNCCHLSQLPAEPGPGLPPASLPLLLPVAAVLSDTFWQHPESSHPDWKYHLFWMISLYSAAPAESHIQLPGFPDLPFLFQEYPADFLSLLSCLHTPAAAACHIHVPAGHIRPAPVCW